MQTYISDYLYAHYRKPKLNNNYSSNGWTKKQQRQSNNNNKNVDY